MTTKDTCIVLAAGASSRMGCNKMLLPWQNRTVLSNVISNVQDAGMMPLIVLGCDADAIHSEIYQSVKDPKRSIVINENWQHGMITSIQAGMLHGGESSYWLLHGDMPCLTSQMLVSIITSLQKVQHIGYDVIFPQYNSQCGHPVWVSRALYEQILLLPAGERFKPFLKTQRWTGVEVPYKEITMDIDTQETYVEYYRMYVSIQHGMKQ